MAAAAALANVHQYLAWIGFGDIQHRNAIIDEGGFERLTDFYDINEMDIRHGVEFLKALSCCQLHYLWNAEDQMAHITNALGPTSPTMFRGPRP